MQHQLIEVNKLEKSPQNARRTIARGAAEDLKASIIAYGILHNLVVTAGEDGVYRVTDGGRRLEALKALQAEGKLAADYAVPCQVREEQDALETSLAANTVRLAMHKADEFEAFARLADAGQTPEQIAERFGKTTLYVRQMLRLGNADPKLLKEYRAEHLPFDCLLAFAVTDDRKRQMKVYRSLKDSGSLNPRAVRAALTDAMAEASSKLARFVGVDAYREAGGTTQSDLFSDAVYLENPALLGDLAAARLDAVRQELEAIAGQTDAGEGNDDDLYEQQEEAEARLAEIDGKIEALDSYDPDHVAIAGCYVSIAHNGSLSIEKGLVRKQDLKRLAKPDDAQEKKPKGMPDTLRRDLEAYRLQIAQVEIARNRLVALDLLVFTIVSDACHRRLVGFSGLDVHFRQQRPAVKEQTPAGNDLKAIEEALPLAWLKAKSEAEQFRAFSSLVDTEKLDLLAWCVAGSLKPRLSTGKEATAYELALSLAGAEVAGYWRPTVASYLGRITRDQLLSLGRDILGEPWAQSRSKDKKGDLAAYLERAFAEPEKYGRTPEQLDKLTRWLPEGMAFSAVAAAKPKATKKNARKAA